MIPSAVDGYPWRQDAAAWVAMGPAKDIEETNAYMYIKYIPTWSYRANLSLQIPKWKKK